MMSPDQARVVDAVLTEHARGYSNGEFIGSKLFPFVDMPARAAKRIEFGREAFRRYQTQRAPGSQIGQISFGYEGKPVSLVQHALAAKTPVEHQEEANAPGAPGIDVQRENVDLVLYVIAQELEIRQANLARNADLYAATNKIALAGAAKWTHVDSDPLAAVTDAKEVIRKRTGRRPNTMGIGAPVAAGLTKHPKIREHFKHTTSSTVTHAMLQAYFEVDELAVGDAIYDRDDGTTVDVWGGDAILAFVPRPGARNMRLPGYGYTYRLRGHPFVQPPYYDRSVRSWLNDVFDEHSPEMVGPDAGFLFQGAA